MKDIVVIYHRADFDGLFCCEIARRVLGSSPEYIGWDFADAPLADELLRAPRLFVMDLPVDRVFGLEFKNGWICRNGEQLQPIDRWCSRNITWIDHHASSIASHPRDIPGYRIDGVAACRLAWHWFLNSEGREDGSKLALKQHFIDRQVEEPLAVRLAGEYDIWDKRDPDAETFQFGLRSRELNPYDWDNLLDNTVHSHLLVQSLLSAGHLLKRYQREQDASVVKRAFEVDFEGLKFLALNTARCNSLTFEAAAQPHHDGLMGFYWTGRDWSVSLYHSPHHPEHDLSALAVKYGGGGHRGACGFRTTSLPFMKTLRPDWLKDALRPYDECAVRADRGFANPIDEFILNNEPAGSAAAEKFRADLAAALSWLARTL